MRMSSLVLPLLIFVGVMVGFQNYGTSLLGNAGIDAEGFSSIESEQEDLNNKWTNEGSQQNTWREESSVSDAVGVVLIPRIASDIVGVGQTMSTIASEIGESKWVPGWTVSLFNGVAMASVFFALAGAYLRYRA